MSCARPSPRLFLGSVVRTMKHTLAVGEMKPSQGGGRAVTDAGQPPVGATSSQFVFVVTPLMPASEKAWIKCCAAAQKSGLPIAACHGKVVEPVRAPVGHALLKLQRSEERRVGKEGRFVGVPVHDESKRRMQQVQVDA